MPAKLPAGSDRKADRHARQHGLAPRDRVTRTTDLLREDLTMAHIDPLLERNRHFAATATAAREGASITADCGTHFLADTDFRRGFADLIGRDDAALAAQAVVHPEQTVTRDVELLRSSSVLPATITVSGHVYDVDTGLITTIVPAAPMHGSNPGPEATTS